MQNNGLYIANYHPLSLGIDTNCKLPAFFATEHLSDSNNDPRHTYIKMLSPSDVAKEMTILGTSTTSPTIKPFPFTVLELYCVVTRVRYFFVLCHSVINGTRTDTVPRSSSSSSSSRPVSRDALRDRRSLADAGGRDAISRSAV